MMCVHCHVEDTVDVSQAHYTSMVGAEPIYCIDQLANQKSKCRAAGQPA